LRTACILAAAYLLGGIPFGLILGRWVGGTDVRAQGSGNIGATNVARSLGWGAGALTLVLDAGKGAAAVALGRALLGPGGGPAWTGLAAIAGHVFPVYLRFRGGKGVATGWGVFLVLAPAAALLAAAIFGAVVVLVRRVSPGSIVAAASLPLMLAISGAAPALVKSSLASSALIIIRHRENIRNLLSGTEPRLGAGPR
jgi:glycerol-3-phosphate acyltransferase PlsY